MTRKPESEGDVKPAPSPDERGLMMQRVRIGAIGLASVFLLVLLAASVFGLIGRGAPHGDLAIATNGAVAENGDEAPKEPLAELGVAPGNAPEHAADNVTSHAVSSQHRPGR